MAYDYKNDPTCFGGSLLGRSHAKVRRPFRHSQALHITLRSSHARGRRSLHTHLHAVRAIIERQARRFDIKLYRYANAGNHLHILVRPPRLRAGLAHFLRAISGLIARLVLKAERGQARGIRFWDQRPFSRIIAWGKAFQTVSQYVDRNIFEALGFDAIERELDRRRRRALRI